MAIVWKPLIASFRNTPAKAKPKTADSDKMEDAFTTADRDKMDDALTTPILFMLCKSR